MMSKTMNKQQQYMQFSKKIVVSMVTATLVSTFIAFMLVAFKSQSAQYIVSLFNTVSTLTGSVILGYFGKAGVQNYNKIKASLNFDNSISQQEEQE